MIKDHYTLLRNNVDKTWLVKLSHSNIDITIYLDELHSLQIEWFKNKIKGLL